MLYTTFLALRGWTRVTTAEGEYKNEPGSGGLVLFLWMFDRNVHARNSQSQSQNSKSTTHHVFHEVLDDLPHSHAGFARHPITHLQVSRKDWGKIKYFADVRGAIDGTHIEAYIPLKRCPLNCSRG